MITHTVVAWNDGTSLGSCVTEAEGIRWTRLSHARRAMSVRLTIRIWCRAAGLGAVLALAVRCELATLVADRVYIVVKGGSNAAAKIMTLVGGMVAGADSITVMGRPHHGGWTGCSPRSARPPRWASFCACSPRSHPPTRRGRRRLLDPGWPRPPRSWSTPSRSCSSTLTTPSGRLTGMRSRAPVAATPVSAGLNALLATICTPLSASLIAATRLRHTGAIGLVIVRANSAY